MDQIQSTTVDQAAGSPFLARAANVFASPSELYQEVAALPSRTSSWLIPILLSVIVALLLTFSLYNNPVLRQQVYDIQQQEMKKSLASGKMTQDQFDRTSSLMESSGPVMFMGIGGGFATVTILAMFFGGGLVLWLAAKVGLKFAGSYTKVLEVSGLASLVGVLGTIVTLLMMNLLNTLSAAPAASLLVLGSFDTASTGHRLLASLNVFTLWEMGVVGLGLGKISGRSAGAGMLYSYGLWAVWAILSSLIGFGTR